MGTAILASKQSVAARKQVGCVIVPPSGIIATGWNGMPAGFDNSCENYSSDWVKPLIIAGSNIHKLVTKPEVIHAERNALDKLAIHGVTPKGSILFTTCAPCIECAKSIAAVGIKAVYYMDTMRNSDGLDFLVKSGVKVHDYPTITTQHNTKPLG